MSVLTCSPAFPRTSGSGNSSGRWRTHRELPGREALHSLQGYRVTVYLAQHVDRCGHLLLRDPLVLLLLGGGPQALPWQGALQIACQTGQAENVRANVFIVEAIRIN